MHMTVMFLNFSFLPLTAFFPRLYIYLSEFQHIQDVLFLARQTHTVNAGSFYYDIRAQTHCQYPLTLAPLTLRSCSKQFVHAYSRSIGRVTRDLWSQKNKQRLLSSACAHKTLGRRIELGMETSS